jgi:putative endonuclease
MPPGALTQRIVNALDSIALRLGRTPEQAPHLALGSKGEQAAYFHLRKLGYVIVARNYRTPFRKSELDLIGWDGETLCFIEVKTRTSTDIPAEDAVDAEKRDDLRAVARDYLHRLRKKPTVRFDIVSVYFENGKEPAITLFKDAFHLA